MTSDPHTNVMLLSLRNPEGVGWADLSAVCCSQFFFRTPYNLGGVLLHEGEMWKSAVLRLIPSILIDNNELLKAGGSESCTRKAERHVDLHWCHASTASKSISVQLGN